MEVKLVKATIEDAQNLLDMQKICFAPLLERYQDYNSSPAIIDIERIMHRIEKENCYKIIFNDICVGSINIRKLSGNGNYKLHIMYILPEYQGKGIGQITIREVEKLFPDAKTWCLEAIEDMQQNRHVYEKMGYVFSGDTKKVNSRLVLVKYHKECI